MEYDIVCFDSEINTPHTINMVKDKYVKLAKSNRLAYAQKLLVYIESSIHSFGTIRFAAEAIDNIEEYIQHHCCSKKSVLMERAKKLLCRCYLGRSFLIIGPDTETNVFDCCSSAEEGIEIITKLIETTKNNMTEEEKQKIIKVLSK